MQLARRRLRVAICCVMFSASVALPLFSSSPASAAPTHYVKMSDGTLIAINVRMPNGFVKGKRYPTIFEMSGYDGGSADGQSPDGGAGSRGLTKIFYDNYVTVHASVRGTGCSSGEFDLFSWRSALDGREVIEWIASRPWSNGDVGYYGHSYGGITGFMIAATRPPHLRAASVSGLIDDLYRGMVYREA
jgi:putative CocE/NonD family hydrolase